MKEQKQNVHKTSERYQTFNCHSRKLYVNRKEKPSDLSKSKHCQVLSNAKNVPFCTFVQQHACITF